MFYCDANADETRDEDDEEKEEMNMDAVKDGEGKKRTGRETLGREVETDKNVIECRRRGSVRKDA